MSKELTSEHLTSKRYITIYFIYPFCDKKNIGKSFKNIFARKIINMCVFCDSLPKPHSNQLLTNLLLKSHFLFFLL